MDLSWSWDGLTLYAASSDGTIAAFQFDASELEGIATHTDQEQYLAKFGFTPPPLPEGYSHVSKHEPANIARAQTEQANGFDGRTGSHGPERVNILVAKRAPKDKKRAALVSNSTTATPAASSSMAQPNGISTNARRAQLSHISDTPAQRAGPLQTPSRSFSNSFPAPSEQQFVVPGDGWAPGDVGQPMELDVQIDAYDTAGQASARGEAEGIRLGRRREACDSTTHAGRRPPGRDACTKAYPELDAVTCERGACAATVDRRAEQ